MRNHGDPYDDDSLHRKFICLAASDKGGQPRRLMMRMHKADFKIMPSRTIASLIPKRFSKHYVEISSTCASPRKHSVGAPLTSIESKIVAR
jgi:hypothetical protein